MNNFIKEKWRDIKGYEGLYQVSNLGRVKSLCGWNGRKYIKREKIINPWKQEGSKNYFRSVVGLTKNKITKTFKVHRLVANAFIPNPENKPEVNHKDGNPLNNIVENLEWVTSKENIKHSVENELRIYQINTIDRDTMLELLNSGRNYDEISKILNIAKGTVFNYIKNLILKKHICRR